MRSACLLLSVALLPLASAEWNQWLGPDRDGKSPESGLLATWPESGPEKVWQVESLGEGYSSLSFANGILFTQGVKDGKQYLIALDAETGKTAWRLSMAGRTPIAAGVAREELLQSTGIASTPSAGTET